MQTGYSEYATIPEIPVIMGYCPLIVILGSIVFIELTKYELNVILHFNNITYTEMHICRNTYTQTYMSVHTYIHRYQGCYSC